jgi:hypothetical protein
MIGVRNVAQRLHRQVVIKILCWIPPPSGGKAGKEYGRRQSGTGEADTAVGTVKNFDVLVTLNDAGGRRRVEGTARPNRHAANMDAACLTVGTSGQSPVWKPWTSLVCMQRRASCAFLPERMNLAPSSPP